MQEQTSFKRFHLALLGRFYSFAYHTRWRRFLGFAISSWIKLLAFLLFIAALVFRWGSTALLLTGLLFLVVQLAYWRFQKIGFNRFIVDSTISPPATDVPTIKQGKRVSLYATGTYSLVSRERTVLLRPAEYWHSAAGEHGVMVNEYAKKYLYQFFRAGTLQGIEPGWLIFGKNPMHTLAITFNETWGPEQAENVTTYMVGGGEKDNAGGKTRTIYFTFEDTDLQEQVWQTILSDLPG